MTESINRRIVEVILAVVLLLAAVMKYAALLEGPNHTDVNLSGGRIPVFTLAELEIVLGIWLLTGRFSMARFYCVFGCFSVFAIVALTEAVGAKPSCGCFGNAKISPVVTGAFDSVACLALWLTRLLSGTLGNRGPSLLKPAVGVTMLVLAILVLSTGFVSTSSLNGQSRRAAVADPASWLNKPFPLWNSIPGSQDIRSGRWLLVFYRYGCEECRLAIPNYVTLASLTKGDPDAPHLAFITVPPYAAQGDDPVPNSTDYVRLAFLDNDWSAATPVVVALQDGRVMGVSVGETVFVPSQVSRLPRPG